MNNRSRNLYARLKYALLRCDVFTSDGALRAVFADPRICAWTGGLPHTRSLEQRVDRVIAHLRHQYTPSQENALLLLLQVLGETVDPGDVLHWMLDELSTEIERTLIDESLEPFRLALQSTAFEDMGLLPLAGQVIAGTGTVALNYIDDLVQGGTYLLEVTGTSMEYEGIFEGDHVIMRAFTESEWPREGDMIVTKYLPYDVSVEVEMVTDFVEAELAGPTLKVFHQKANGEFYLGWQKDNRAWSQKAWAANHVPGNRQGIVTKYISPIGRVLDVKRRRNWDLTSDNGPVILGGAL